TGLRIEGGASPFASAVEPREDNRSFPAGRRKLAPIAQRPQSLQHVVMRLNRSFCHHVFVEDLTREGSRQERNRLRFRENFTVHLRWRNAPVLDLEERRSSLAVKHVNMY